MQYQQDQNIEVSRTRNAQNVLYSDFHDGSDRVERTRQQLECTKIYEKIQTIHQQPF